MMLNNNTKAFFELVRAGLWGKEVKLSDFDLLDFDKIYSLAEEQAVVGIVAAGVDVVSNGKIPQVYALTFVGSALQIEQRNLAMNHYLGELIEKLRQGGVYTLLVKGQGIAQCYERPLWRSSGDIDFFMSKENYEKAKDVLLPRASYIENETKSTLHLAMTIDTWMVELHGTLRCGLSPRIDKALDDIQNAIIYGDNVRSWLNGNSQVFLLRADEDVVYVFSHILQHFFKGGIGIRQLCDLARLLWTYKTSLNHNLLRKRLVDMGVMTEWKAFGCVLVNTLGLPEEAMPFYDNAYKRKSERVLSYILEVGNFGHNKDISYQSKHSVFIRKTITFLRQAKDSFRLALIFPDNAFKSLFSYWRSGMRKMLIR